ncbi:MAG: hypothetical protein KDD66_00795 [Bdellovibrionales bacterium]|nr:hypothetical protein [Bdellovibrionales bacterium]
MGKLSKFTQLLLKDDQRIVQQLDPWSIQVLAIVRQAILELTSDYMKHRRFPIAQAPSKELYYMAVSITLSRWHDCSSELNPIPELTVKDFLIWYESEAIFLIESLLKENNHS